MQFTSTIISFFVLAMSFSAMAAPLPVPVAGVAEIAQRDAIEIKPRGGGTGTCMRC